MKTFRSLSILFFIFNLVFSGCVGLKGVKTDSLTRKLIDAYVEQSAKLEDEEKDRLPWGVNQLEITKDEKTAQLFVSLESRGASLARLIEVILNRSGTSYFFKDSGIFGKVTARFENKPFLEAINFLLNPYGFAAELDQAILIIHEKAPAPDLAAVPQDTDPVQPQDVESPLINLEIPLDYLDTDIAASLLDGLFPKDLNTNSRKVNFSMHPNSSNIYMVGPVQLVRLAARTLKQADQKLPHVFIESLVVEYELDAAMELGLDFSSAQAKNFSSASTNFGSLTSDAFAYTYESGSGYRNDRTSKYTASLDALIKEEKARIISRPYIAALSGQEANVQITNDRYLVVNTSQGGAAISAPQSVTSGVLLEITPTVLNSDKILVQLKMEESDFVSATGNVAVEVDKNFAASTMHVKSGQTIVIGGLLKNKRIIQNNGLPWVKHIPIIKWFAGQLGETVVKTEVVIYLTPHIWEPGMEKPLVEEQALAFGNADDYTLFEQFKNI